MSLWRFAAWVHRAQLFVFGESCHFLRRYPLHSVVEIHGQLSRNWARTQCVCVCLYWLTNIRLNRAVLQVKVEPATLKPFRLVVATSTPTECTLTP